MTRAPAVPPVFITLLAGVVSGCGTKQEDCLDGYARDNQGRCQVVVTEDTGIGMPGNTAPTAPAVALQPVAPREQGAPLVCQITTESVDVDGDEKD